MFYPTIKTNLVSPRLLLSKVTFEDSLWLFNLIQENKKYLSTRFHWVSDIFFVEDEEKIIRKMMRDWDNDLSYCFSIKKIASEIGIGMISVIAIDKVNLNCEIGYWISEKHQSKGYVSEALHTLEKELFELNFKSIYLKIDSDNKKSIDFALRNNYSFVEKK
jgi:RimJ/RimL family protein N-acetyltransferase